MPTRFAARMAASAFVAAALDVEEVHDRRDAVAEHFGEGERGADLDPPGVEAPGEGIEDVVAPRHEVQVVPESSEE
jgi:hypothetical protein